MRTLRSVHLILALAAVSVAVPTATACFRADRTDTSRSREAKVLPPKVLAPTSPSSRDWIKKELQSGRSVVLTNSYLFELMKGVCQENQKATEERLLVPLVTQTLQELARTAKDSSVRQLVGVPLLLLTDEPGVDLPEETAKRAAQIRDNPLFKPRGHYTDSASLRRYFQAMQYLAKATIDVSVRRQAFPYPEEMLYPFETAQAIRALFSDPANKPLVDQWAVVHSFYSAINGPPDLPTFMDLPVMGKGETFGRNDVEAWASIQGLPKMHPEGGLGIQPLGERFTIHESAIDSVKRAFMTDDTPREKISELLRFGMLLRGYELSEGAIKGLDAMIPKRSSATYYIATLRAISLGARGWHKNLFKRNFYAACMASLAEQTALMTKTSVLVRKSPDPVRRISPGLKIYFEPDSEAFIRGLAGASNAMTSLCRKIAQDVGKDLASEVKLTDIQSALETCAGLSAREKPLLVGSSEWQAHGETLMELPRNPAVTVDVFQVKDRSGKTSFYQWAIAPFEAAYQLERGDAETRGMITVFFEGWSDEIFPGTEGPLNNLQWEGRVRKGNLGQLHSIIDVPQGMGAK